MRIPLNTRINLRGKFAASGFRLSVRDSISVQSVADRFWRCYGIPLSFWLSNPYRSTLWRDARLKRSHNA